MMQSPYQLGQRDTNSVVIKSDELIFLSILCLIGGTLFFSLYESTSVPLVIITVPLVFYNRAFLFPMFLTLSLCQGAFSEATSGVGTSDASYAESLSIAAVAPFLLYDLITQKSKMIPYRFVVFYVILIIFIYLGIFVYYQHPENYITLGSTQGRYAAVSRSIIKSIKVVFYLFYLKVLINYPLSRNIKTLEVTRRCAPFVIIPLGIFLLTMGRVQNGTGYSGTLQLGDAHHGIFTSELCALTIYVFITLFSRNSKIKLFTRFIAFSSIVLVGMMIMVMGSRNGLVCFALVCCIGVFIHLKLRSMDFQFIMVSIGTVAAIIAIILSLQSPTVQRAIYMMQTQGGGDRVYYWTAGLKVMERYPLLGLGGDESSSIGAVAHYSPVAVSDRVMHNTYLEMAVEYGLIAAVFYIIFVIFTLTWGYRLYKIALDKQDLLLAAPVISFFIIMFSNLFVSNVWGTPSWYNMSLIFALSIQMVYPAYVQRKKVNTFSPMQNQLLQTTESKT
jgi:O-antigen ligase